MKYGQTFTGMQCICMFMIIVHIISRLWNRNVVDQPKLSNIGEVLELDYFRGKEALIARPFFVSCSIC